MKDAFQLHGHIVNDKIVKPKGIFINAGFQNLDKCVVIGTWPKKEGHYLASSHNIHESIALWELALADLKRRL